MRQFQLSIPSTACASGLGRDRLMIEALEARTLLSVGTLVGAVDNLNSSVGADVADPDRDLVYFVDTGNNKIVALNTNTGTTAAICTPSADVSGLAVSVDDTRLFASEPGAFQIEVFSLPTLTLVKTLNVGVAVDQIVALANDRIAGMTGSIGIFDAETGDSLYSVSADYDGLIRSNTAGTMLYSRAQGLSGNDGSIRVYDTSGTGAPVSELKIPGPTGANSTDFNVDPVSGYAYMEDGGVNGIEVTLISSGAQTTWNFVNGGGAGNGVAALEGGQYVYASTFFGNIEQFNHNGVALATIGVPDGDNGESLVITPNGNLVYTFPNGIGIVGITTLSISETPHLAFHVPPLTGVSGQALSPNIVVDVEDPGNNIMTADDSNVTLSLTSGSGTLSGTLTVAAQNGVATFTNVVVNGTGTFRLTAADTGDTSATTGNLSVFAAAGGDTITFNNGIVLIVGTTNSDTIAAGVNPLNSSEYYFLIQTPGQNEVENFYAKTVVTGLQIDCDPPRATASGTDNDYVNLGGTNFGFVSTVTGGDGSDTVIGQQYSNHIYTGVGTSHNLIYGSISADLMISLGSSDSIRSGGGADTIEANSGNNVLVGGKNGSDLVAGAGWDTLRSGAGNSTLHGSQNASAGTLMLGGFGNDYLDGTGSSNDTMIAGSGIETLIAGSGTYFMDAGWDSYLIVTGGGTLPGATGADSIAGGDGVLDTIVSSGGDPTLVGSTSQTVWDLNNPSATTQNLLSGDYVAENDTINPSGATTITVHLSIVIKNGSSQTNVVIPIGAGNAPSGTSAARTTDANGTVVFQTNTARTFTLADFFDHWGVAFDSVGIGQFVASPGSGHTLSMTVNGVNNTQFNNYPVVNGDTIVITFNT